MFLLFINERRVRGAHRVRVCRFAARYMLASLAFDISASRIRYIALTGNSICRRRGMIRREQKIERDRRRLRSRGDAKRWKSPGRAAASRRTVLKRCGKAAEKGVERAGRGRGNFSRLFARLPGRVPESVIFPQPGGNGIYVRFAHVRYIRFADSIYCPDGQFDIRSRCSRSIYCPDGQFDIRSPCSRMK